MWGGVLGSALFPALSKGLIVHQGELHLYHHLPFSDLAFQDTIRQLGGRVCDGEKVMEIKPGLPVIVKTTCKSYQANSVVITAGPWTNRLLRPLGLELPLQVRGTRSPRVGA